MGRFNKNQSGFTAVEILLALIFVAIVTFIGIYLAHNRTNKAAVISTAQTKKSSTKNPAANTHPSTMHTAQEATSFVQTTYNNYLAAIKNAGTNNTQPLGLVGLAAVKDNLTSDFYSQAAASPNGSAFSCAGQFEPSSYSASLGSVTNASATVDLTIANSGDGSTNTTGMTANVDLTSLKITSVNCPS